MLHKKCAYHKKEFPEENEWFPCTDEYFYKNNKNKKDGLCPECKRCASKRAYDRENINRESAKEYKHQYYLDNKEERLSSFKKRYNLKKDEWKIYQKQYMKNNPEKIKMYNEKRQHKNHKINKSEWESCKKYFNNECAYCGLPLSEHYFTRKGVTKLGDFHKEHVNHEGSSDLSNCVPSCGECNSEKHKKIFEEWYNPNNSKYTEKRFDKIIKWLEEDYKQYIEEFIPKRQYNIKNKDNIN